MARWLSKKFRSFRTVLFGGLCAALCGGCSLWSSAPPAPAPDPVPVSPVVLFLQENTPGASASFSDAEFGGEVRIIVDDEFLSAANELCRKATVLSSGHEAEVVVICRDNTTDSAWRLMPRIWGKGI